MKKFFSKELLIGLTVLITLLILFFGIDYLKGINLFHSANYYYVSYENVDGLAQSAPVKVNGYKVGLVREIQYEYDNPGHILVELSLDRALKVPSGSKAVLVTDMLGTSTIDLQLATGSECHNVGDKLIGVNASGLMDNVTKEILPEVGNILPHIDSLLLSVTGLVTDPALLNSIRRLDNVMANLEISSQRLTQVMNSLPPIVSNASTAMQNVDGISENLKQISADLAQVSAQLKVAPIDSTLSNINRITANLDHVTNRLNGTDSSLGLLLNDKSLYNNINNSAAHIDSILIDLKRNPKHYIPPIKIF